MKILSKINREIIHYASGNTIISSKYRTIFWEENGKTTKVKLPEPNIIKRIFGLFRISRRVLRLDKCNVFMQENNLVIIRQSQVYLYERETDRLSHTLRLRNCRNVLHQSINATPDGMIFFGEYGHNGDRRTVPVWRSTDNGKSWEEVHTFPENSVKHIHGCYYDKYTDKIWVCTGDFEGENYLFVGDRDFKDVKQIGNGEQQYRACNLMFTDDKVHWLMDSQLEPSHHVVFDRQSETIKIGQKVMGPIVYIKKLGEKDYLAASAQEIGPGVLDDKLYFYRSTDLKEWKTVRTFDHDGLPKRYFKFGMIGFADGDQSKDEFYMFFEAVKGFDGISLKCSLR